MKKIFVFIADGFEEVEAVTPIDYLRRAGLDVITVGIPAREVVSAHGIKMQCDTTVKAVKNETPDTVIFPGGLPNARTASRSAEAKEITLRTLASGFVAGICAAPALVFYEWGLLDGKKYTCYPEMDAELPHKAEHARVVIDGNIITACGAGAAEEFSFTLVEILAGKTALTQLKKAVVARK